MVQRARLGVWTTCVFVTIAAASNATAATGDVVLYATDATTAVGNWTLVADTSAAGGQTLASAELGWGTTDAPLASPPNYFEFTFTAAANTPYHVWLRLRAGSNSKFNDSVYAQFSDAVDSNNTAIYRIGTPSGLDVNLQSCNGCAMAGWGWMDGAYWLAQSSTLKFAQGGTHTLRIQTREDGVSLDQVVLSPSTYLTMSPGQLVNDAVIVAKPAPTVPAPWKSEDVGTTGLAGGASSTNGVFTLKGAGADIWGTTDAFQFVSQPVSSDTQMIVRVTSLQNTHSAAKAGLMLRESSSAGSAHVVIAVGPSGAIEFMTRSMSGALTTFVGGGFQAIPVWLKLTRHGSSVTGSVSPNGTAWTEIGTTVASMTTGSIGMAVTSHDATKLNTATFDGVGVSVLPMAPATPAPAAGANGVSVGASLSWSSAGATSYDVSFGTTDPPAPVATGLTSATFMPSALANGATYFWQIIARNTAGTTAGPVWSFSTIVASPTMPSAPTPVTGTTQVATAVALGWSAANATSYDVSFGAANPPPTVATGLASATYTPANLSNATTYFWRVTARNDAGTTAGAVWWFTTAAAGLPTPWQGQDIGMVGVPGGAAFAAGTFTVAGAGADIWGAADAFAFVSQPIGGDVQIVARVVGMQNTSVFAKAGVMLRDSTAPNAPHVILDLRPDGSIEFMTRRTAGGATTYLGGGALGIQPYLKLTRSGTTISGAVSPDGVTWTTIGTTTTPIVTNALVGLAVTSVNVTTLNVAAFDQVVVSVPPPIIIPPPTPGRVTLVPAGADLQHAIDTAVPGDTLQLAASATFTGNFVLRAKPGAGVITITSAGALPTGRVSPASAGNFATLTSANTQAVIATEAGAHDYVLIGLHVRASASSFSFGLVELGANDATQTTLTGIPAHFTVDRCYIHGDPAIGAKRGIDLNAVDITIKNSYISDIKGIGLDTQGIAAFNGPGPYVIDNNYVEAAGENILFGGSDPYIQNLVPSDIRVTGNYISRPVAWKTQGWQVKNLFELKNARRVVVTGNVFENNWSNAQTGVAILITPRNQDGRCTWCTVADVDFEFNIVRHTAGAFNLTGVDDHYPTTPVKNIKIANNLMVDIDGSKWIGNGDAFKIGNGPIVGLVIDHNTIDQTGNIAMAYSQNGSGILLAATGFVFTNNIVRQGAYGFIGESHGIGLDSLNAFFPGFSFTANAIESGGGFRYPAGQVYPSFVDYTSSFAAYPTDFAIKAGSVLDVNGSDGLRIGVDVTKLPK